LEVRLGAEKALTPPGILAPAFGTQDGPAVASNGHDFLAIWRDQRRGLPVESPDLYASRLTRDGQPVDRVGHRIAEKVFSQLVIAFNGGEYLACYVAGGRLVSQRLDENGAPIAPPTNLGLTTQPFFLRSNGSGYLLVGGKDIGSPDQSTTALLLDGAGAPLGTTMNMNGKPKAAGARDGGYVIVTTAGFLRDSLLFAAPLLYTISASGSVTELHLPTIQLSNSAFSNSAFMTAALSPDAILIGWDLFGPREGGYMLAGYDGRTIRTATPIVDSRLSGNPTATAALWDGHEFLVAFNNYCEPAMAFRVSSDGSLLDAKPLPHPWQGNPFDFASADGVRVILWPDGRFGGADIMARTFTSFDSLLSTPVDLATLISWSAGAQTDVQAARSGNHQIAAWLDQNGDSRYDRILAYVDDVPIELGRSTSSSHVFQPAVTASRNQFLIVWYEGDVFGGFRVLAKRVTLDGRVLDYSPILLWTNSLLPAARPAIASDGSMFLVSWTSDRVYTARLSEEGAVLTLSSFLGSTTFGSIPGFSRGNAVQAAWTGTGFFVGFSLIRSCNQACKSGIGGLTSGKPQVLFDSVDSTGRGDVAIAMAYGAGRITFVWLPPGSALDVAQTTAGGTPLTGPRSLIFSNPSCVQNPAIGWDGAEMVVAWNDQCTRTVQALRLNQFGDAIELPFDVATDVLAHGPSVVPTSDGVTILYDRPDETNTGVPRAFERSLARLPPATPRGHSASH
jgi:hypothetical protein